MPLFSSYTATRNNLALHPVKPRAVRHRPALPIKDGRSLKKRLSLWLLIFTLTIVVTSIGYVGYKFVRDASKISQGGIFGLFDSSKLAGEDQGRVNILLAGDSADDPGHGGADLTDSIMVVSIDTKNNTAFMLSIPRDLWVDIPGHGWAKINAAYEDGGMSLLETVVGQVTGLHMDYYTLVDYTAFRDSVNAVGGIDVDIQSSDPRGIYDPNISAADDGPLILKNGWQHLNGQTALNLARARNDPTPSGQVGYGLPNGDFDRTADQRLMLTALEKKIFSTDLWANPIKVGQLLDNLGNNVTTNFQIGQLMRLYTLFKSVKPANIQSLSLTNLVTNYAASGGQAALIPQTGVGNYTAIKLYVLSQTSSNPVLKEGATVVILNGSNVNGLAAKTQSALISDGIDVTEIADASGLYGTTSLEDNSGGKDPATLSLIDQKFGNPTILSSNYLAQSYDADFVLILGENQSVPQ